MGYIDLHCHILPGIDDGSPDMETSLGLAKAAVENGIEYALLTPHHMNGRYVNHKKDVIRYVSEFKNELLKNNIPLKVFPGQEVRINGDLLEAIDHDDILYADEDNTYMMLEFPSEDVPAYTEKMIFQIISRGITPVIVHPERNTAIINDPTKLERLLNSGCLTQITASSYVGTFGKTVQEFTERLIAAGQGGTFASDAHALAKRDYELDQAYKKLSKEFGVDKAREYQNNAKAIINGEPVQMYWKPIKKKKRFWLF